MEVMRGFTAMLALAVIAFTATGFCAAVQAADAPASSITSEQFHADKATAEYLATMSPAALARSNAYFEGGYWLLLWDFLVGLIIAWALLAWRLSARMRDFAVRMTRFRWAQTALYALQYFVITAIVTLPWDAYEGYIREHQYGMSNQGFMDWLGDQAKGLIITLILGAFAVMSIYAVIRRLPKTWWLWGSMVAIGFLVFQIAISPLYLEPVFNRFYPLAETPLKQRILSLARANEIPARQVYEFDASKQTTKISAHVSGMLGSAQISLNDNLVNRSSPEEIEAVMGHEMGHYVLNHMYKGILAFGLLVVGGFVFISWAFSRVSVKFGEQWGFREVGDVAGMPLLLALFSIYTFLLTPAFNTITRTMEAEADAFGLNASRQPDGFAQAALHLSEYRKMRPGPVEEAVFFDHPSGWNRVFRAMIWKAENLSAPDIKAYDALHHPPGTVP